MTAKRKATHAPAISAEAAQANFDAALENLVQAHRRAEVSLGDLRKIRAAEEEAALIDISGNIAAMRAMNRSGKR